MSKNNYTGLEIAVIGMAGRFPGAEDVERFWDNLKNGIESTSFFSDEELREAGVREELLNNPDYVKAGGYLEGIEEFDADFFDYAPMEAEVLEPQVRLFHQCAWEALEHAGYAPDNYDGLIGLYAGASDSFHWKSLAVLSGKVETLGQFEVDQLTNKDYLCARLAYKLDLKGPVVFVQTACSTSLVAIHMACQGLLSGESDMALAGGATIIPFKAGYIYQEGMIQSPDGHCRAFDVDAKGTMPANGLGMVVLKRLEEAVEEGDTIHAVIKGSAINNDGTEKIGFTAPSVEGQCEAIKDALQNAQVGAESIGYLEAHGTGTFLGDPVEMEALTLAFNTTKKGFCGIGSVKSNFGHLDSAAGVAGFIKTVLALKHRSLPPTLHFEIPNDKIDLIGGPFYINRNLKPWRPGDAQIPLRAGVSSLGIGGTNAHVILEEPPPPAPREQEDSSPQLIILSAKTPSALQRYKEKLARYLKTTPNINLADAAYTLQVGRKVFKHQWSARCSSIPQTIEALTSSKVFGGVGTFFQKGSDPPEARHRIPLPVYPFEGQRYWIEGDLLKLGAEMFSKTSRTGIETKTDIGDWIYIPSWKRVGIAGGQKPNNRLPEKACWLLFIDDCGLGVQLAQRLEAGGETVVTVKAGSEFQKLTDGQFIIHPQREKDYDALFEKLRGRGRVVGGVVHLWSVTGGAEKAPDLAFYSLLDIARRIGGRGVTEETRLFVISDNMQEVTGGDGLCPGKAVILGPVKVIPMEYTAVRCFSIDVELAPAGSGKEKQLTRHLVKELTSGSNVPVTAYRGGYRWVQSYEPLPLGEAGGGETRLRRGGVYLVTGGLGGIGLALAGYLAKSVRAKLVLTGRGELPAGEREQKIKALEQMGAGVMVCKADVTDDEQMRQVIVKAEGLFGAVNGIIHCAGVPDGEMIQLRTVEASQRIFAAKITGTLVLDRLIKDMKVAPDFFILCSSVTAILPMIGQVAYCGANAFLDAFAHYRNSTDAAATLSINWDRWRHVGIAAIAEDRHKELTGEELAGGISREQGIEIFARMLAHPLDHSQLVVSLMDFGALLEHAYAFNAVSMMAGLEETGAPKTLRQRPELNSEYVSPGAENQTQQELARLWGNFFGFQQVGIRDDFFQLGGDSLKALVLLPKIHKELDVYIPIAEFFNRPTIRELSEYIDGADKSFYSSIEPIEKKEYYPLSSAQKRLYLLQQIDLNGTGYNIPLAVPLAGDIDKDRLEEVFKKVIARHESLRTSFLMIDDQPVQRVHDDVPFEIHYTRGKGEKDNENFVKPFDLTAAPLLRSGIVENPDGGLTWLVDVHHIVSDGMSQSILTADFISLYNGEALAPLKLQYRDFSRWQNRLFAGEEVKAQESYWLNLYRDGGEISRLNFPSDYKRPETFTFAGAHYGFTIGKEETAGLRKMVSGSGGTLFMGILAVLNILAYKYTGQTDIIIGSGTAGRPQEHLQPVIGMFVNTLVTRNFPRGEKTAASFLKEVVDHSLKAFENQDVQFEELVDKLDLERDPSRNPLFDISIVSLNFHLPTKGETGRKQRFVAEDFSLIDAAYNNPTSRFDMTFFIHEPEEEVFINIEYYTAIYKRETIQRLVSHFKNIVKVVVANPSIGLKDIEIITEEEKRRILYEFNDTIKEYPKDKTIHELFEEQAGQIPDHTAVVFADRMITTSELNRRSGGLAAYLIEKGVHKEDIVGIMSDRSLEMIIGILGILKAGAAYLPINSELPETRKEYILNDSNAKILLERKGDRQIKLVDSPLPGGVPEGRGGFGLAYIIYTSGSTGKPKGVMVEHSNVVRLVKNNGYIEFNQGDRLLLNGALEFDISTFELWGPLLNGAQLYLAEKDALLDAENLKNTLIKYDISILHLIPQLFNRLAHQDPTIFASLVYLLVGGDLVSPRFIEAVRKRCGGIRILHMYGPTENTTFSSFLAIERSYEGALPIGKPIANSSIYILGPNHELMPVGVPGEICTGGDGTARGYLNNPELTAERFLKGPRAAGCLRRPGGSFEKLPPGPPQNFCLTKDNGFYMSYMSYLSYYKTGDLGRWLPDGSIEFFGRIDHQVKVRGVRIELGEIQNLLLAKEEIKEAVVLAVKEGLEAKYLCAYIVSTRAYENGQLREILSTHLPPAMIPSYFIQLDKMPLTTTGKIDRKALPVPDSTSGPRTPFAAPGNAVEIKLAEIWAAVLEIAGPVSIDDNFFHLGGHSLNAAILISRIHREMELKVPLAEIFRNQTIRKLASYIQQLTGTAYSDINPVEKREYYAPSSAQKRLYFLQQMDSEGTGYNMPFALPPGKDVEKERLESAFKKLIARHESLRTSFMMVGQHPVQRVHEQVEFKIEYYDSLYSFIRPFDLTRAPLLRSGLIKNPDGSHTWLVDMHHIISDGTSQTVFIEDLLSFYRGNKEEAKLPRLRIQYKDFSRWQNRLFAGAEIKKQETYWLNLYADAGEIPKLDLPSDNKRPGVFNFAGDTHRFMLEGEDGLKFKALASAYGGTLYMNFLAAFNVLFYKYSGHEDMVIGSGIAGRSHEDLQPVIGMFINTLPMRNYPKAGKTYHVFLKEAIAHSIAAFENQDIQFEHLVDKLNIERDTSRNPLFDITMVVQNFKQVQSAKGEELAEEYRFKNTTAKFDLTFFIYEHEDDIYIDIEYYTAIFKEETIQRLVSHFKNVVKAVVEKPSIRLKDIEIITEAEKQRILYEFNDTIKEYPGDKTIHELFEEQAGQIPDHIAAASGDRLITTGELNRRSDGLAVYLIEKGVHKEDIVGIMSDRSLEMVIGILGILKAGAAYLPINSELPETRKEYILKDSSAKILLEKKGDRQIKLVDSPLPGGVSEGRGRFGLAYIIYTSGSTGKPKGVMVEHRGVVRLVKNTNYIEFRQRDRLLLNGALEFDISTFEIWGPLLNGAQLYLAGKDALLEAENLKDALIKYDISILHLIPQLFNRLADQNPLIFGGLNYLLVGGDLVRPTYIETVRKKCAGIKILHMYGPTENTTFSSYLAVERSYEGALPIGKPIANSSVYILGPNHELMPVGVSGEICTAGDGAARGYLNNPELTAEKFLTAKTREGTRRKKEILNKSFVGCRGGFSKEPLPAGGISSKLYSTGDLGRWLPDGNIEFLGRVDHQVKIRGVRIELAEIENRLLAEEDIDEAAVLAVKEGLEAKYLCAYIVAGRELEPAALREALSAHLPPAVIPSYFVQLAKMPLTATGKIDRKSLPDPVLEGEDRHIYVPPRDEIEKKLVEIWSEVLEISEDRPIGIDDNFFQLGGHSLKAAVIAAKIHEELNVRIPLAEVFKRQTVRGLGELAGKAAQEEFSEIQPVPKKEYYDLSFNQKRLWFIQQRNLADNSYNMPFIIEMNRRVDEEAIQRTVETIIRKHESLRTGFKEIDGTAVQYIVEHYDLPLDTIDISTLAKNEKRPRLKQIIDQFSLKPFHLGAPPLFESLLVKVNHRRYIFAYNLHHIITDGWSMEILERDFYALYEDCLNIDKRPPLFTREKITYKDFAYWHNRRLGHGAGKQGSREFWMKFLKEELPPLNLPRDFAGPAPGNPADNTGASFRFVIAGSIKDVLKQLTQKYNITLFVLLYSIYNIFLSLVSGQRTVVSSIVNAGRDHPSLRDTVGFFVNSIIFKKEIAGGDIFIDFAGRVQETVLEFFKHQNYPLELVLDEAGMKYPQVNTAFNMINVRNNEEIPLENLESFHHSRYDYAIQNAKFDIEPYVSEYSNAVEIFVSYNKNLFKSENIELMMKKYRQLIEFFAMNPLKRLKDHKETKKRKSFKRRIP